MQQSYQAKTVSIRKITPTTNNSNSGKQKVVQQKLNLLEEHQKRIKNSNESKQNTQSSPTKSSQIQIKLQDIKSQKNSQFSLNLHSRKQSDCTKQIKTQNNVPKVRKSNTTYFDENGQCMTTIQIQLNGANIRTNSSNNLNLESTLQNQQNISQKCESKQQDKEEQQIKEIKPPLNDKDLTKQNQQQESSELKQTQIIKIEDKNQLSHSFEIKQTEESNSTGASPLETEEEAMVQLSKLAKACDMSQKEMKKYQKSKQGKDNSQLQTISIQLNTAGHLRGISSSNFIIEEDRKVKFNQITEIIP